MLDKLFLVVVAFTCGLWTMNLIEVWNTGDAAHVWLSAAMIPLTIICGVVYRMLTRG